MTTDEDRGRPPPAEGRPRRPDPQSAPPSEPAVLPFPARRSRRRADEEDWPPGAA